MRLLITGGGAGGTCWLAEVVRANGAYNFTKQMEDRQLFEHENIPDLYATKRTTEGFVFDDIDKLMKKYPDLYVLFSIKHPVSHLMAMIARLDNKSSANIKQMKKDTDNIFDIRIKHMHGMFKIYKSLKRDYPDRVSHTKLEERIVDIEGVSRDICKTLGVEFNNAMVNGHKNTRNEYHQKRYGDNIDKSQLSVYSRWETYRDGFFKNRRDVIDRIKNEMADMVEYFNY